MEPDYFKKKYGITALSAWRKEKYSYGVADFGAVARQRGYGFHTRPLFGLVYQNLSLAFISRFMNHPKPINEGFFL